MAAPMMVMCFRNFHFFLRTELRTRLNVIKFRSFSNFSNKLTKLHRPKSVFGVDAALKNRETRFVHIEADDASRLDHSVDGKLAKLTNLKSKLLTGPSFEHFLSGDIGANQIGLPLVQELSYAFDHPYVRSSDVSGNRRKVYFEVYGCQMNVNDTDIAWSILSKHDYTRTTDIRLADVILVVTCAIRDSAEQKVWNKLEILKGLKRRRESSKKRPPLKIGILGCMAERLKHKLLEKEKMVDLVAGPDSYRDLPRMLAIAESGHATVNVLLSLDETYADVMPAQLDSKSVSGFVSIMRGCDNMCSYCIVPFTRGRERSRPLESILDEVRRLSDNGVKEIILLGQNVNSYREVPSSATDNSSTPTRLSRGFSTLYRLRTGGYRFVDLLEKVAEVNSEMRIRFTSPHPKDFPDEVLQLIKDRSNICNQLHLPAQSGNNRVLSAMRRGYTRDSYLDLVSHIRSVIPDIAFSSDFICGFCGETEAEFEDTLSMMQIVKYNVAYLFPYSMRERTHAYHKMIDDVPQPIKIQRQNKMVAVFRAEAEKINRRQIGQHQLVLVEGSSKRSSLNLAGRNDHNTKVIFTLCDIPESNITSSLHHRSIQRGDYVVVEINDANSQVLKGTPLYHVTLKDFNNGNAAKNPNTYHGN